MHADKSLFIWQREVSSLSLVLCLDRLWLLSSRISQSVRAHMIPNQGPSLSVFTRCSSHTRINHSCKSLMLQLENKPQAADLSFTATTESQMHRCRYGAILLISTGNSKTKLHVGVKAMLLWLIYLANHWVLMTCPVMFSRQGFLYIPRMLKLLGKKQQWFLEVNIIQQQKMI